MKINIGDLSRIVEELERMPKLADAIRLVSSGSGPAVVEFTESSVDFVMHPDDLTDAQYDEMHDLGAVCIPKRFGQTTWRLIR